MFNYGEKKLLKLRRQTDKFVLSEGASATFYSRHFNTTGVLDFILRHRQKATDKSTDFYHLPTKLRLQLTSLPQHGVLFVSKSRAEKGQYFDQVSFSCYERRCKIM
jgi:hypothetical protein